MKTNKKTTLAINKKVISKLQQGQINGGAKLLPNTRETKILCGSRDKTNCDNCFIN